MKVFALFALFAVTQGAIESQESEKTKIEEVEEIPDHEKIGSAKCPADMDHGVYCEACLHMVDHMITTLNTHQDLDKVWNYMCEHENFDVDFLYGNTDMYEEHVC